MQNEPTIIGKREPYMSFGTRVPICKECLTVRVTEAGDTCNPCKSVLANRQSMYEAAARHRIVLFRIAIIVGIVIFGVITAAIFLDK